MAFVAPDGDALTMADLASIDWEQAVLRLAGTTALVPVSTNAEAILRALHEFAGHDHAGGDDGAAPTMPAVATLPAPAVVLVWRDAILPCYRRLDADEAALVAAMDTGVGFAKICARLTEQLGAEEGIARAGTLLARWAQQGICARPAPLS